MDLKEAGNRVSLSKLPILLYVALLILTAVLMVISFPAGIYAVFYTKLSASALTYASSIRNIYIVFGLVPIRVPVNTTIGVLFLVFSAIYAAFFVLAAAQKVRFFRAIRSAISQGFSSFLGNPLIATVVVFGAIFYANTLLDYAQTSVGIQTGSLSGDPLLLFLGITIAPFTEELGFRVGLIGVPLFIAMIVSRSSIVKAAKSLWRPSNAWRVAGASESGATEQKSSSRKTFTYFMLFVSAAAFGVAHFVSGAGWQVGKVSEAAAAGIALGYLYVRYGFHTSVLLHWAVNFFGSAYAFLSQGLWGIPWDADSGPSLGFVTLTDAKVFGNLTFVVLSDIKILGIVSFYVLAYKFLKRLLRAYGREGA